MRRNIRIALLSLGVLAGYGSGFAHLACFRARHAAFEAHVAKVCADAAKAEAASPAKASDR
jgi:hypothetical protein